MSGTTIDARDGSRQPVGAGSTERARWALPLIPVAISGFLLSAVTAFRVRGADPLDAPGFPDALVATLYGWFGFEPLFLVAALVLAWSSIWFLTGEVERPWGRVARIGAFGLCVAILVNLRVDGGVPADAGAVGAFFAARLTNVLWSPLAILIVAAATLSALLLATDFFFYRWFERLAERGRGGAATAPRTAAETRDEDGVEPEAIAAFESLRASVSPIEADLAGDGFGFDAELTARATATLEPADVAPADQLAGDGRGSAVEDEAWSDGLEPDGVGRGHAARDDDADQDGTALRDAGLQEPGDAGPDLGSAAQGTPAAEDPAEVESEASSAAEVRRAGRRRRRSWRERRSWGGAEEDTGPVADASEDPTEEAAVSHAVDDAAAADADTEAEVVGADEPSRCEPDGAFAADADSESGIASDSDSAPEPDVAPDRPPAGLVPAVRDDEADSSVGSDARADVEDLDPSADSGVDVEDAVSDPHSADRTDPPAAAGALDAEGSFDEPAAALDAGSVAATGEDEDDDEAFAIVDLDLDFDLVEDARSDVTPAADRPADTGVDADELQALDLDAAPLGEIEEPEQPEQPEEQAEDHAQGLLFATGARDSDLIAEARALVIEYRRATRNFLRRRLRISGEEAEDLLLELSRRGVVAYEAGDVQGRVLVEE